MPTAFNEQTGELLVLGDNGQWAKPTVAKNPQTGETLYHDGADWKPMPMNARDKYVGQTAAIANGAALGFGDEFLAGVGSVFDPSSGGYDKQLADIRTQESRYRSQDPAGYFSRSIISGLPLAAGTGAAAARGVAAVAPTLGRVGQAAGVGALYGGIAGFGSGEGDVANRVESAGFGAWTGALLGATVEGVVSPVVSRLVQFFRSSPALLDPKTGQVTPQGSKLIAEYAQKEGVDVNQMGQSFQSELLKQAQSAGGAKAVNPSQAIALAEAKSLPSPVPMTQGQLTLNPEQQLFESQAAKGVYGQGAQTKVSSLYDATDQALRDNQDIIRQKMIGSTAAREPGQRGALIQNELATLRNQAKSEVNSLYDAARKGGDAAIAPDAYKQAVQNIAGDVFENYHPDHIPLVSSTIQKMQNAAQKAGDAETLISSVFRTRRQLVSLQGNGGVEGSAAGAARQALDKYLINTIDEAALSGDANAISRWKDAISAFRGYAGKFEGGDLVEKLIEKNQFSNQLALEPESAIDVIFGRSSSGFVSKANMSRELLKIKGLLGETSDAWKALKEEAFLRFMRTSEGAVRPTERAFSGAKLSKAWEDAMNTHPEVLRQVFTDQERSLISQFVRVAKRVTTTVPGGANSSDTSGAIVQALRKVFGSAIFGPKVAAFLEGTPFLKGFTQLPDEMKAAAAINPMADTVKLPPKLSNKFTPYVVPAAAGYAGQKVNQ